MKNRVAALIALTVSVTVLSLSACAPVDKDYGVQSSEPVQVHKTAKKAPENVRRPAIMSDDKVMPKLFKRISRQKIQVQCDLFGQRA